MASYNTHVHPSHVLEMSDKSLTVVLVAKDGVAKPFPVSRSKSEWKQVGGDFPEVQPTLFLQTWYAKLIGLADKQPKPEHV